MSTQSSPSQLLAKSIGIVLIIAALTGAGYVAFVKGPSDLGHNVKEGTIDAVTKGVVLAERLAKDCDKVFHFIPCVTSGGTVIVQATSPIRELATVRRNFSDEYSWEQTWLRSTKRITLGGDFIAKAGFDLSQPFSIDISDNGATIRATVPPAKILSVEETQERIQDEDGWWNKLTASDRENVKNAFLRHARDKISGTDILAQADKSLIDQLEAIIRSNSPQPVTIIHTPASKE